MKVQIKNTERQERGREALNGIGMFLTFAGIMGEMDEPQTRQREGWMDGQMDGNLRIAFLLQGPKETYLPQLIPMG